RRGLGLHFPQLGRGPGRQRCIGRALAARAADLSRVSIRGRVARYVARGRAAAARLAAADARCRADRRRHEVAVYMRSDIAVVILAGGEGSRIGGAKPLRPFAGERLIDRALGQAARWSDLVAIAVRDPAQAEPVEVPMIADAPEIEGPLGGLAAALHFGADSG